MKKAFLSCRALLLSFGFILVLQPAQAAIPDVTGLTPTLHLTFDNESVVNDNGSGAITSTPEGTVSYITAPNGKALDSSKFTPYGNLTDVTQENHPFSVSAYAKLNSNPNGILFHLCEASKTGLVLRRGVDNQVILTIGNTTTPVITVNQIDRADIAYHHYAILCTTTGIELYVDGISRGTTTATTLAQKKHFQFGSRYGSFESGEAKNGGAIDDFRVYNDILSEAQIELLRQELIANASTSGVISIKTGIRGANAGDGNIWTLGSQNIGPIPSAAQTWNRNSDINGQEKIIANLQNNAGVVTDAKLYYTAPNYWSSAADTSIPNGILTKSYMDDGPTSYTINDNGTDIVLPHPGITRGWQVMLTGVPHTHADLYIIIASDASAAKFDACPILLKIGEGDWTYYHGLPGTQNTISGNSTWRGANFSRGPMLEGNHYLLIPLNDLTPTTPISIAHGVRDGSNNRRLGLAGLQIVPRAQAADLSDHLYRRSLAGSVLWDTQTWDNAGQSNQAWLDSTPQWPTAALLTTTGDTTLTLPDLGVTAESVSVRGIGAFSMVDHGALNLSGRATLDLFEQPNDKLITIATQIIGANITLAANNLASQDPSGSTLLSNPINDFESLTLTHGTLNAASQLPAETPLVVAGGALLFTGNDTFKNPLVLNDHLNLRVAANHTGILQGAPSGSFNLKKLGAGALVLNGGGSWNALNWEENSTITLSGTAPFAFNLTPNTSIATTLELYAPVTLSDTLHIGHWDLKLNAHSDVTVQRLRGSDGGNSRHSTITQDGGKLTVLGSINNNSTTNSVLFAHWNGSCVYVQKNGGEFKAPNAVALITWTGGTTWHMQSGAFTKVKGINFAGQSGNNEYNASLTVENSTLEIGASGLFASQNSKKRALTFNQSTLKASDNFAINQNATIDAIKLEGTNDALVIDPQGYTITDNRGFAGTGQLVLDDRATTPGTLHLNSANTHAAGTKVVSGTLQVGHVDALNTGTTLAGGTLSIAHLKMPTPTLALESDSTLKLTAGLQFDWSDSGTLAPQTLTINTQDNATLAIILDLAGAPAPLNEYPIILCNTLPQNAVDSMTITFSNGGAAVAQTATVQLVQKSDGIYASFGNTTLRRNLFWRNGNAQGIWSLAQQMTPWGIDGVNGSTTYFDLYDAVTLSDTDQEQVTITVEGMLTPYLLMANNNETDYVLQGNENALLTLPATGLTKEGSGTLSLKLPVEISQTPITLNAGVLSLDAPQVLTINKNISGAGTLEIAGGNVTLTANASQLSGHVLVSGGTLNVNQQNAFNNSTAHLTVAQGATLRFTQLDASGYNVSNQNPINLFGTLEILERDTLARGIAMHDGAVVLLNGKGNNAQRAIDLFKHVTLSLDSGNAIIKPLNPAESEEAQCFIRSDLTAGSATFDIMDANATLTLEVPFTNDANYTGSNPVIPLIKKGAGTLKLTKGSSMLNAVEITAGTLLLAEEANFHPTAHPQGITIANGAALVYDSTASQTLQGDITCNGTLNKSGSGKLTLTGTLTVSAQGNLQTPAVATTGEALKLHNLNMNGTIKVLGLQGLRSNVAYPVITADTALPADLASRVSELPAGYRAHLSQDRLILSVYKQLGTFIMVQ